MKKILTLLFFLIATASIGQYPINQILSSDSTMVSVGRNATGGIRGGLVNMVFTDTTAANLSRISYYTGAQIWTTTDSAIWVRFKGTPSFWVKMAGASGGTTGSFWNITGNYFGGGVPLNYGVGTNSYDYLPLKTNNITRLLIPPDGILRSSAPANKYLMMDTTTLEMYYGDGGGGSGWSLTGNSINAGTDFIGTTNNTSMRFRTNNTVRMVLDSNGNVGIGTTAPAAKFEVNGSNVNNVIFDSINLIVKGNTSGLAIGSYSQPVMFFYPKKWAFRAGFANSGYWDDANIGIGTAAFGHNTKASGSYSLVAGNGNISTGNNNAVFGVSNTVSYDNSIVAGTTNTVSGYAASSFGSVSTVDGYYGNTLGYGLINKDYGSTVVGWMNDTTSHGANTTGSGGTVPNPQNRIFVVGNGTGSYGGARSNALTVLMSGNVGIGTSSPDSLLTVELGIRGKRGARFDGLPTFADTTNYKPVVINSSGTLYKATYWPGGGGGSGWSLTGNAGTTSSNFIGTTDDQPLSFRVNNRWAGRLTTSGNIFWGDSAGVNNIGYSNVAIGRGALRNDVGGINLVAIGDSALYNNLGDVGAEEGLQNTAVGSKALYSNTTGSYNTANGYYSLYSNTIGSYNTANGLQSLYSNTTGYYNTANGTYSLYSNTTGFSNTANGHQSLYSNTTGYSNTANGLQSLISNTTGGNNTANGTYSLYSNTTGGGNTANGYRSLYSNTTGNYNTANGYYSLYSNTTGDNNVGIGYQSGNNAKQKVDAKNQILIGAGTYGTRDSIAVIGANFMKETILRGKLIDSTLSAGAGTKAVRWNSSTGEFTYADTTAGGGSPAGSNKQVQYNNSGSFGGAAGVEIGNTNNRLLVQSQSATEVPLIVQMAASQTAKIMSFQNSSGTELSYVDKDGNAYFNGIKMGTYGGEKGFEITTTKDMYFVTGGDELSFEPGGGTTKMRITYYPTYSQRTLVYGGNTLYEKYGTNLSFYPSSGNSGFGAGGTENLLYITTTGNVGIGTTSPSARLHVISTTEQIRSGYDASNYWNATTGSTGTTTITATGSTGSFNYSNRLSKKQGADVASASNLVLGYDGNTFEITGTNDINLISNVGWQNGSIIYLIFAEPLIVANNQSTSGTNIKILLPGGSDFSATAEDVLTLVLSEVGGVQAWRTVSVSDN